jgi:ribonuclease-3 family protein
MDYFKPNMSPASINAVSMLGLAHIGDAVFELMTRASLCAEGHTAVQELHRRTTARVNAPAQARSAERILPLLSEEESAVYRRGRNTHVNSVPHAANVGQYHAATGLEALFGWLYLQGRTERLNELFSFLQTDKES